MSDEIAVGPIDFILIEFPEGASTSTSAAELAVLVDLGVIRLYDMVVVSRDADGGIVAHPLDGDALEGFGAFAGAQSGLFHADDLEQAAAVLEPGTRGLMVAYENAWAGGFVSAAHAAGGRLVASERIPAQALLDALDAVEAAG